MLALGALSRGQSEVLMGIMMPPKRARESRPGCLNKIAKLLKSIINLKEIPISVKHPALNQLSFEKKNFQLFLTNQLY